MKSANSSYLDMLRREATVGRQLLTIENASTSFGPTTTDASVRTIPLPTVVVDALVKPVQARLGHASAVETLDTYSHLWPESDDRTRKAIDAVLGADDAVSSADSARTPQAQ